LFEGGDVNADFSTGGVSSSSSLPYVQARNSDPAWR
jgi:hypothetical protein